MQVKEINSLPALTPDETLNVLAMKGTTTGKATWSNIRAVIDSTYPTGTCGDADSLVNKTVQLTNYNGDITPREFAVAFTYENTESDVTLKIVNTAGTVLGTYTLLNGIGENSIKWKAGTTALISKVGDTLRLVNSSSNDFVKLTKAEYEALTEEEKMLDKIYFITDDEADPDLIYTKEQVDELIDIDAKDEIATSSMGNESTFLPVTQGGEVYKVNPTVLKRDAVANCSTIGEAVAKTATVNNMSDFILVNGTIITVYFEHGNTATNPTLNINNTGAFPLKLPNQGSGVDIGSGCWNDGFIGEVKYIEISSSNKFYLLLGHNIASKSSSYTTLADGTTTYSASQVNGALADYGNGINLSYAQGTVGSTIRDFCESKGLFSKTMEYYVNGDIGGLQVLKIRFDAEYKNIFIIYTDKTEYGIYATTQIWANMNITVFPSNAVINEVATKSDLANLQNPISKNYLNDNVNDIFPLDDKELTFINIASETNNLPTKDNAHYLVRISKDYVISTLSAFYEECEKLVGQLGDTGYKYQRWGWVDTNGIVWGEWQRITTTSDLTNYMKQYSLSATTINTDSIFDIFGMGNGSLLGFRITQLHANYLYYAIGHIYRFSGGYRIVYYGKNDNMGFTFNETTGSFTSNYALDCVFFPQIANI